MTQHDEILKSGALKGIRVVDFTAGAQGPWAGALLADMGADVIKVEPPGGEWMRHKGEAVPSKKGLALAYMGLNHGKRHIVLDLKDADDKQIALKLIEQADVYIENWRAGVSERLGLGYEDMSRINPRIIFASSSGFGYNSNNAYVTKPGMDNSSQAMSGMTSVNGPLGGPGQQARFTILDLTGPLPIVQGVILALIARERTGHGQWVQLSQTETGMMLQSVRMAEYFATKKAPLPMGSRSPNIFPSQSFRTKDGWIDVEAPTRQSWMALCRALQLNDLINDPRFATNAQRVEHRSELVPLLESRFLQATSGEWLRALENDVPVAPVVWSIKELYDNPQVKANGLIMTKEHPIAGSVQVPALPWTFSKTPAQYKWVASVEGSHQDEVLEEIGIRRKPVVNP